MATNKVVVAGLDISASQLKDLFRQIEDGSIVGDQVQAFLEHRDPFAPPSAAADPTSPVVGWCAFLAEMFGINIDPALVTLPAQRAGFGRLIVIPAGLTLNQAVKAMRSKFNTWTAYDDLDKAVVKNARSNTMTYAIWLRDRIEADKELKERSANDLSAAGVNSITLLERLLYELKCFAETRKYLDTRNVTLCAGSRCSDGSVPGVGWCPGGRRVCVYWCDPGGRGDSLRARAVVSLPNEASARVG